VKSEVFKIMTEILITGGAGFIGSYIAEDFASKAKANSITIIDNLARDKIFHHCSEKELDHNLSILKSYDNIRIFKKDLRDYEFIKNLVQETNFDYIFHVSGQTAVIFSIENPIIDFEHNIRVTMNLLEAIRISNSNPKLFYFSTNKVFGRNVNELDIAQKETRYVFRDPTFQGISESFPVINTQHSPYGTSKLCSELYIQEYDYTYDIDYLIIRMSCIYGPRQCGMEAQGWVSHIIKKALRNEPITIFGNGKQVRDILYITDLLKFIELILKKDVGNEIFNIGGGINNSISILELIGFLEKILDANIPYAFENWRIADQKIYVSDISKAIELIGWKPKISLELGINKMIKWYQDNKNYLIF
jgi:CDP-paratose 2-epimerase